MKPGDLIKGSGMSLEKKFQTHPVGIVIKKLCKMKPNGKPSTSNHYIVLTYQGDIVDYREYQIEVFASLECDNE
jgi:hypothetical protein